MSISILTTLRSSSLVFAGLISTGMVAAADAAPKVVASIKPVHSLVAGVMEGIGEPELIVDGAGSPHAYALKPSQAGMLQDADLVFWIGPSLETFLEHPIETLGNGRSVPLMGAAMQEGGHEHHHEEGHEHSSEAEHDQKHDHDEASHGEGAGHEDEAGKVQSDHGADDHEAQEAAAGHHDEEAHDHGDGHDHGGVDPHVWLNPDEAGAMVHAIEAALSKADPANADGYHANAEKLEDRLASLSRRIETELKPVQSVPFIVFHSAYGHFSERFGIAPAAAVAISPDRTPSAAHIREVEATISQTGAACVFAEPQFEPKLVSVLIEGTKARQGVLDPLGADLQNGPDLYFELLDNIATSLKDCLSSGV